MVAAATVGELLALGADDLVAHLACCFCCFELLWIALVCFFELRVCFQELFGLRRLRKKASGEKEREKGKNNQEETGNKKSESVPAKGPDTPNCSPEAFENFIEEQKEF